MTVGSIAPLALHLEIAYVWFEMKRILLSSVLLLLLVRGLFSQTAPDAADLTQFLKDFLAGAGRNDAAMHDRFWADDLIYTSAKGLRKSKADIMREVQKDGPSKPGGETAVYTAEEIRIQQYGDTAILAFRLVATGEKDGKKEVKNYLNSGTFLKRDGKWQVVIWQATAMPDATGPKP